MAQTHWLLLLVDLEASEEESQEVRWMRNRVRDGHPVA
jgi:hypothetical protein